MIGGDLNVWTCDVIACCWLQKGDSVQHAAARHGQLDVLKFFTVHGQTLNVTNLVSGHHGKWDAILFLGVAISYLYLLFYC